MADAPPSYAQATGGSKNSSGARPANGIPVQHRRSMEDENRPLPAGWIRQYDPNNNHQYFVDTRASPPRSIWHHPHDDDKYLSTLPAAEREQMEELNRHPSRADIMAMSSSESLHDRKDGKGKSEKAGMAGQAERAGPSNQDPYSSTSDHHAGPSNAPPSNAPPPKGLKKFGRNMKDRLTGTTHEQREQERLNREIQEQQEYEMHVRLRTAMTRAFETGQPQLIGRDRDGKDVYMEPPNWNGPQGYGNGYGNGYGYNPYRQGPYTQTRNAVFYRPPEYAYSRPTGYGYGGGLGMPIAAGFLGGALLGGLLF